MSKKGKPLALTITILLLICSPGMAQQEPVLGGYLPHYRVNSVEPGIFDHLTHLYYFHLTTNASGQLGRLSGDTFVLLEDLPEVGQHLETLKQWRGEREVKIYLVLGGFGDSEFAAALADSLCRAGLIGEVRSLLDLFELDGLDLDWETYRGDTEEALYGLFISELRENFSGSSFGLSAAVYPTHDRMVPHYKQLDFVQLMSYGRHFGEGTQVPISMLSAWVDKWINAGMQPSQVVVGIPFFGKTPTDNSSLIYKHLREYYSPPDDVDQVDHEGKTFFFNSVETVAAKAAWVRERGIRGAMAWEIGQDVPLDDPFSLLKSLHGGFFTYRPPGHYAPQANDLFRMYPNPGEDFLMLEFHRECGPYELIMTDMQGRELRLRTGMAGSPQQLLHICVSDLPAGLYMVSLRIGRTSATELFIKQ